MDTQKVLTPGQQALIDNQLDEPTAPEAVLELPCGYLDADGTLHTEVVVREMTGAEEDMLASKQTPDHKKFGELVRRCVTRLGTETDPGKLTVAIDSLPLGDRVFLLFAIRRVSLGETFPFISKCPECEKESMFRLNLADLDVRKMPEPTKRVFETTTPTGKKVAFRPLFGKDDDRLSMLQDEKAKATMALAVRIITINGEPASVEQVQNMSIRDRNHLRDTFEESDGGVDTAMDMQCPRCMQEYEQDVGIGQTGFFFPSRALKSWKRKSSS